MQIPREYQAPIREMGISKIFEEYKTIIEKNNPEGSTSSKNPNKFLKLIKTTDLLDKAFVLVARKVESLAKREITNIYGLEKDTRPNFCSKCGYKIEGSWKLCPICGKKLGYGKLDYSKAVEYMKEAIKIDPDDQNLKRSCERVKQIISLERNKENALFHLRYLRAHHLSQINLISAVLSYKPH
jgi:hypothetical protein